MPNTSPSSKWESPSNNAQQQPWLQRYQKEVGLFTLLLTVLLIIAVWLPNKLSLPSNTEQSLQNTPKITESSNAGIAITNSQPQTLESPWQDAQTAKARREAQEILAKLMDRQTKLENMSVTLWAKAEYLTAQQHASTADDLYRQRQFIEAQALYLKALQQFDDLLTHSTTEFQSALQSGTTALLEHNSATALHAFQLATAIDSGHLQAQQGLIRAQSQPQVVALFTQSKNLQNTQQWIPALEAIEQALELDAADELSQQHHAQLQRAITERNFKQAMGRAYIALQNNQINQARKHFLHAKTLKPESTAVDAGLHQLRNQQQQKSLKQFFKNALRNEKQEQWQQAADNYAKALQQDRSLIQAKVGQIRSAARAKLDHQLRDLIDNPLRLANDAVFQLGRNTLDDARAIKQSGPVLQRQIGALSEALALARQPINVTLKSDNATEVTVYKVGKLGQFSEQHLELIPGKYTAIGSRQGYRDVRTVFTISPTGTSTAVLIQCTEKIALDS